MTTWRPTKVDASFNNLSELNHQQKDIPLKRQENCYPNYCITWSKQIRKDNTTGTKYQLFCCCGGVKAVIVGVETNSSADNNPKNDSWRKFSTFIDDDPNESYRACTFGGRSSSGAELLVLGGVVGVIQLVDVEQRSLVGSLKLKGHDPGTINDLKVSPTNESFLLSASTDESIRLWNLTVKTCVAVFTGRNGHRRAVLSVSWDLKGIRFASSGVDGFVRLWDVMCDKEVVEAIHARSWPMPGEKEDERGGMPHNAEMPYFQTSKPHDSAVDCVHWLTDELILSKGRGDNNEILLWTPDFSKSNGQRQKVRLLAYPPEGEVIVLKKFQLVGLQGSFSRFSVDSLGEQLVAGEMGCVFTWNLYEDVENENASLPDSHMTLGDERWHAFRQEPTQRLKTSKSEEIRVISPAPDGRVLVACSDGGTLYRWWAFGGNPTHRSRR